MQFIVFALAAHVYVNYTYTTAILHTCVHGWSECSGVLQHTCVHCYTVKSQEADVNVPEAHVHSWCLNTPTPDSAAKRVQGLVEACSPLTAGPGAHVPSEGRCPPSGRVRTRDRRPVNELAASTRLTHRSALLCWTPAEQPPS